MMHRNRSRDPPPYHPGWGGLARKLFLEESTFSWRGTDFLASLIRRFIVFTRARDFNDIVRKVTDNK